MNLRQYLNVCYAAITAGMDEKEKRKIDMLLEGRDEKEIVAVSNRDALKGLAGFMGQAS